MFYLELSVDADKKLSELIEHVEVTKGIILDKHDAILYILDFAYENIIEEQRDV